MGSRSRDHVATVRRIVAAHLPDYQVDSVVPVGEGSDNLAYEVNAELIVRWSKEPDPAARAARVDREARLPAAVASISPLPVPELSFTVAEQGCLAYRKLPGVPLLDLPRRAAAGPAPAATKGVRRLGRRPARRAAHLPACRAGGAPATRGGVPGRPTASRRLGGGVLP